jgi:hypothetical protein
MLRTARARAYLCVALALTGVGAALVPAQAAKPPKPPKPAKVVLGPNLLPNPSFEQSVFEPAPVPQYATSQPLLPVGWSFEGATGLFDHGQHGAHTGKRAATISDPASTPRNFCQQKTCLDDPAAAANTGAALYYSETPMWRTQSAVPVTAGKTYQLSAWVSWSLETIGYGAVTAVRWVDASGMPVGISAGPKLLANVRNSPALTWTQISGVVTAPKGATGAIVLLGDDDGPWISSLTYDDAYFGTYTLAAAPKGKKRHR